MTVQFPFRPAGGSPAPGPTDERGSGRRGPPVVTARAFTLALALALAPLAPASAPAQEPERIVLGLSDDKVSITTRFTGTEILVFGAIRRESPIDIENPLEVAISVAGPSLPVNVRRKSRISGIWANTDLVEVDRAPSFYAVATSGAWNDVISDTEDLRHKVSIDRAIRSVGAPFSISDSESFTDALIRIRSREGVYRTLEGGVALDEQTLFRTSIAMPAQLVEGRYPTRIFLTRNGRVVSSVETDIEVRKVGLERFLHRLAHEDPAIYGLASLLIAAIAGWAASAGFRALRGA